MLNLNETKKHCITSSNASTKRSQQISINPIHRQGLHPITPSDIDCK
jgi:hypothetical protein